ncbi:lipocalin family protein [Pontibacter qinzhouensis]|uniref:Lipocalin family protein n=1 Tax=Pontibacter qinzhouensis TaxID=2603253 RepID=A0A5C8JK59_9BACT|nr:lipocalin family protein [Pontibacter qinzhouensis]TXK38139.1 lipocalin family protein [Pontibacter qinzhouensis]
MTQTVRTLQTGLLLVGASLFSACSKQYPALQTVASVDLNRYAGTWYEIASLPQRFTKDCHCTTAQYTPHPDGYVEVYNSCRQDSPTGDTKDVNGKAFPVEGSSNSKLKVQFFWPFKGDYWILDLADDYSYALVGAPDRESLWILSRKPVLDAATYEQLVQLAKQKGFPVQDLQPMD